MHSRFVDAFVVAMKHMSNLYLNSLFSEQYGLKCYKPMDDESIFQMSKVPNVVLHLKGNVNLHLGIENIFFNVLDDVSNIRYLCLNFAKSNNDCALGSVVQKNFHIEIDVEQRKIGFACTKYKGFED